MRPAHCAREVGEATLAPLEYSSASMRPAHCAREVRPALLEAANVPHASMRPAHCAREVGAALPAGGIWKRRFNEARALCAGSSRSDEPAHH